VRAPEPAPRSYSAPLYVDITKTITVTDPDGAEEIREEKLNKVFIGKVPIMLRSKYCSLHEHSDNELARCGRTRCRRAAR